MTVGRGEAGFTLLEVLVSLGILALVGTALVAAERLAIRTTAAADARVRAISTAASLLAERQAGARGDGAGRLTDGSRFVLASRLRPDLVRPGAAIVPVLLRVEVTAGAGPPARLSAIDWLAAGRR